MKQNLMDPLAHASTMTHPRPDQHHRKRRVSKDAPERSNAASFWTIPSASPGQALRRAMRRIAAQDEGITLPARLRPCVGRRP
jgi:hypothetical protein